MGVPLPGLPVIRTLVLRGALASGDPPPENYDSVPIDLEDGSRPREPKLGPNGWSEVSDTEIPPHALLAISGIRAARGTEAGS